MQSIVLTVSYLGTPFHGWQRQHNGQSVQAVLEAALSHFAQHPVTVRGASRTDAGVHAKGQVAAFTTPRVLPKEAWIHGVNNMLPPEVVIRDCRTAEPGYNPRYRAGSKTYRYLLDTADLPDPWWMGRCWHIGRHRARRFDREKMSPALAHLEGTHDFVSFCAADHSAKTTRRTITKAAYDFSYAGEKHLISLEFTGTAFLKHMVRTLVGAVIDVATSRYPHTEVRRLLLHGRARSENLAPTAPAAGLTLLEVHLYDQLGQVEPP